MTVVAKVANLLLIIYCIRYANNVNYMMKIESMISEFKDERFFFERFVIIEIIVVIFVAAIFNVGNKVLKTGVI